MNWSENKAISPARTTRSTVPPGDVHGKNVHGGDKFGRAPGSRGEGRIAPWSGEIGGFPRRRGPLTVPWRTTRPKPSSTNRPAIPPTSEGIVWHAPSCQRQFEEHPERKTDRREYKSRRCDLGRPPTRPARTGRRGQFPQSQHLLRASGKGNKVLTKRRAPWAKTSCCHQNAPAEEGKCPYDGCTADCPWKRARAFTFRSSRPAMCSMRPVEPAHHLHLASKEYEIATPSANRKGDRLVPPPSSVVFQSRRSCQDLLNLDPGVPAKRG